MRDDLVRQEILRLEAQRREALLSADAPRVSALMAEDLVHIHGNGQIDGKAGYLDGIRDRFRFHRMSRGDLTIRSYGSVVVVSGPISQTFTIKGVDGMIEAEGMVTQIWVDGDDGWKQNTYHMQFLRMNGKPVEWPAWQRDSDRTGRHG